jgi:hypothetical protein
MRSIKGLMTFALLVLTLTSCGGKDGASAAPTAPTPPPSAPSLGAVDPALLGTWSGSLDGSFGAGSFNMTLSSNGTMTTVNTGGSSNYCAISGEWGVASGQFTGRGSDCTGTIVTLTARSSGTTMSGTWTATSGRSGNFSVTKP